MMDIVAFLEGVVEQEDVDLSQHHIFGEIANYRRTIIDGGGQVDFETESELLAFDLQPTRSCDTSVWGTYYRPPFVDPKPDGSVETQPDKGRLTEKVMSYWELRAVETQHPFLRFRYASLSWDLRGLLSSKKKYEMAELIFESAISIATQNLVRYQHDAIEFLLHAMKVAVSTKNDAELAKIRSVLLQLETNTAEDEMLGTWGYCFDNLLAKKSSMLTDQERETIVEQVESRLDRLIASDVPASPHAIDTCVSRLAQYYRRTNDRAKLEVLLTRYAKKVVQLSEQAMGVSAVTWLQQAHSFLMDFGATGLANGLNGPIHVAGAKANEAMITMTHKTTVSDEEMKEFLIPFSDENFESAFLSLTLHFVPNVDDLEERVKRNATDFPLSSMFGTTKMDGHGRPVANVESTEVDLAGNVAMRMADDLQFASFFLRRAIEAFEKTHVADLDLLTKFVIESASYSDAGKLIVAKALEHFLAKNHLEFIHLAIPQIEASVRNLVTRFGGTTLKRGRHGSLNLRNLDELVQESCIVHLYEPVGECVVHYLKILLTDQRGWNLRNCIAHGLNVPGGMGSMVSDRLLHVLMLLALIREPTEAGSSAELTNQDTTTDV